MNEIWPVVCATGHRPQHLTHPQREWTRAKLLRAAEWCRDERGTTVGISGMALGVDLWWADAVLRAALTLAAYVPCPPNPRWSFGDQREYKRLIAASDPVLFRQFADRYSPGAMRERNEAMVHASAAVVAVWLPARRTGGTWHTVRLAVALAMPGVHIDPERGIVRPRLRVIANQPVVGSAP